MNAPSMQSWGWSNIWLWITRDYWGWSRIVPPNYSCNCGEIQVHLKATQMPLSGSRNNSHTPRIKELIFLPEPVHFVLNLKKKKFSVKLRFLWPFEMVYNTFCRKDS